MINKNSSIGILKDEWVNDNKSGQLSRLDCIMELSSLSDFIDMAMRFHITPCAFKNSAAKSTGKIDYWRNQSNFKSSNYLYFDFDDGSLPAKYVSRQLMGLRINHAILASKNHLRDKGDGRGIIERFHLFIPLETPITETNVLKDCLRYFPIKHKFDDWSLDTTSIDVARYYFKHRECLFHWEHNDKNYEGANLLHVYAEAERNEVLRLKLLKEEEQKKRFVDVDLKPLQMFKRSRYFRMLTDGDLKSDGSRYDKSNQIIGAMIKCGLNQWQAMQMFDEYSYYGKGYTRQSVIDRFNKWS